LNAITDASWDNPYLVIIEPGRYDVGTNSLQMKPYVDIQGSGTNTTVILGAVDGIPTGLVIGASGAELRWLTVENSHTGNSAVAIYSEGASPRITHVRARAKGATYNYGIRNFDSGAVLTHVEVIVRSKGATHNRGIDSLISDDVTMNDVKVEVSWGNSNTAIVNTDGSTPKMTNVTVSASGVAGSTNVGVDSLNSNPVMVNVEASAWGGNASTGIRSDEDDAGGRVAKLRDSVATAYGASTTNSGIQFGRISAYMSNVSATASDTLSAGLRLSANAGSYTIVADRCSFSGDTYSVWGDTEFTLNIGASKLGGAKGGVAPGPTYDCVHCYNESYDPLDGTCD
jgi:hypothetical protein